MRVLLVLVLLAGGCGDDTTTASGDMSAGGDDQSFAGADFAGAGDLPCTNRMFNGFNGVQTSLVVFACPCGCTVDAMESTVTNPMWGATKTAGSTFAPIAGVALGEDLHYSGTVAQLGLYSVGPTAQFFLDGDFDMLVDYDLVSTPPGESHLLMSVRDPGAVQSIQTFDIEREQLSDGSGYYATMLGGVPSNMIASAAHARHAAPYAFGLHVHLVCRRRDDLDADRAEGAARRRQRHRHAQRLQQRRRWHVGVRLSAALSQSAAGVGHARESAELERDYSPTTDRARRESARRLRRSGRALPGSTSGRRPRSDVLGIGDLLRQRAHLRRRRRGVLAAADDQRRAVDARQQRRAIGPMRHRPRRRQDRVGAIDAEIAHALPQIVRCVPRQQALRHTVEERGRSVVAHLPHGRLARRSRHVTVGGRPRIAKDERAEPRAMPLGQRQRDVAADRQAAHGRHRHAELVEQRHHVVGELVHGRLAEQRRLAEPAQVDGDDAPPVAELRHLLGPHAPIERERVQEHERGPEPRDS